MDSWQLEAASMLMILGTLVTLSISCDYALRMQQGSDPTAGRVLSGLRLFFAIAYVFETALRGCAAGTKFFLGERWAWNVFDLVLVVAVVCEQAVDLAGESVYAETLPDVLALRFLSVLRARSFARFLFFIWGNI
jgi:hypothetical protein